MYIIREIISFDMKRMAGNGILQEKQNSSGYIYISVLSWCSFLPTLQSLHVEREGLCSDWWSAR